MATLLDRLDAQIKALTSERARIEQQATSNLADVDRKLAALAEARTVVTREVETAYQALLKLGLISDVTR